MCAGGEGRVGTQNGAPREPVTLKGSRDGIALVLDEHASLAEIVAELRQKLGLSRRFFAGARLRVEAGNRRLGADELRLLEQAVLEFGLVLDGPVSQRATVRSRAIPPDQTLLVRRTLRSGQRIDFDGNVVVLGDVNPGAVVRSTGDIVVCGALRGMAHAGAAGDVGAVVLAFRLEPTQLRIAQYISRAPDGEVARPQGPEIAFVRDEMIQIEAYVP